MDVLTAQLKVARLEAEDADAKSEEISRQLALVEDELESVEERVKCTEAYVYVIYTNSSQQIYIDYQAFYVYITYICKVVE